MSRRSLLLIAVFGLWACNPRKPLPVSKDLGPSVQVIDVAAKQLANPTSQLAPLAETEPNDDREHAQRLDPQAPDDGVLDQDEDGYTNLEEYLNSLVVARR